MQQLETIAKLPSITSAEKLWGKSKHLGLRKKDVTDYWRKRGVVEVVRGKPISNKQTPIKCWTGNIGCCQVDLMDISKYMGYNNQQKFLCNFIDVHSRFAWTFPSRNKRPQTLLPFFKKVVADYRKRGSYLVTFYSDDGSEWKGAVKKWLDSENTEQVKTLHKQNMAIVERFNQTIWKIINISFFAEENWRFIDDLKGILTDYNDSPHKGIKQKPIDVFMGRRLPKHAFEVDVDLTTKARPTQLIKIGDLVRRQTNRKIFDKASASSQFSREVYKVVDKQFNRYVLENIETEQQLKDTYLPRQLSFAHSGPVKKSSTPTPQLNRESTTRRRLQREPAFKLDKNEKVRLKPQQRKRAAQKPTRFRGAGIRFV